MWGTAHTEPKAGRARVTGELRNQARFSRGEFWKGVA